MRDQVLKSGQLAPFWPPKQSAAWIRFLAPMHRMLLRHQNRISNVRVNGLEHLSDGIGPDDGILLCPNHSHAADGPVMMEVSRRAPRPFHVMAAWHVFRRHWGLDGWLMQRVGGFSIDREGCDRRAIRAAIELLSGGKSLVIFPEGEIYRLNEKLTPLREGVAFMAISAQRDLDKSNSSGRVWIVPIFIQYRYLDDIRPRLKSSVRSLEKRLLLKSNPASPLHERIVRLGEVLLTLKEKEKLGQGQEHLGDLPTRLNALMLALLERMEAKHLTKTNADELIPVRVKLLRQHLLDQLCDDGSRPNDPAVYEALDDVHLVVQLFSYPGNYITDHPTVERMAETIEKFEEDTGGVAKPMGRREAIVHLGTPIDVKAQLGEGRARGAASSLTRVLEERMDALMKRPRDEGRIPN